MTTVRINGEEVPVARLAELRPTATEWQGDALTHLDGEEWEVEAAWQSYLLHLARDEWGGLGSVGTVQCQSSGEGGKSGDYEVQLCKGSTYVSRWVSRDYEELLAAGRAINAHETAQSR